MDPLLTEEEMYAMELTVDLVNTMSRIVGSGPTRNQDMAEIIAMIHPIQRTIMSQAAARAYPKEYRLLGDVVTDLPRKTTPLTKE